MVESGERSDDMSGRMDEKLFSFHVEAKKAEKVLKKGHMRIN